MNTGRYRLPIFDPSRSVRSAYKFPEVISEPLKMQMHFEMYSRLLVFQKKTNYVFSICKNIYIYIHIFYMVL